MTDTKSLPEDFRARWIKPRLADLPLTTCDTLKAIASQFVKAETDGLENPQIFKIPEVVRAGGLDALKTLGKPTEILHETKESISTFSIAAPGIQRGVMRL